MRQQPYYGRIPKVYIPCENLAVDLKKMPKGILKFKHLLIATWQKRNFVYAIPLQDKKMQTLADALIHRVFFLTGLSTKLSIDQALTSQVIKEVLKSLECMMQIINQTEEIHPEIIMAQYIDVRQSLAKLSQMVRKTMTEFTCKYKEYAGDV